jgi:hypothetical protein
VKNDRLCGLVVKVPGHRFGGPGAIPCITRKKPQNTAVGIRHADHPLSAEVGTNFTDKRLSLGRYSSLSDSGHGV